MYYYRIILENDEEKFFENKIYLSDHRIVREMIDSGELSLHDEIDKIEEVDEETYEEGMLNA